MKVILHSDEVNLLIYRYLQESGFIHTAFVLGAEANLLRPVTLPPDSGLATANHAGSSSLVQQLGPRLPPNCLVSMLHKALLYCWIEHHTDPETGAEIACDQPFGFFHRHQCRADPRSKRDTSYSGADEDDDDSDAEDSDVEENEDDSRKRRRSGNAGSSSALAPSAAPTGSATSSSTTDRTTAAQHTSSSPSNGTGQGKGQEGLAQEDCHALPGSNDRSTLSYEVSHSGEYSVFKKRVVNYKSPTTAAPNPRQKKRPRMDTFFLCRNSRLLTHSFLLTPHLAIPQFESIFDSVKDRGRWRRENPINGSELSQCLLYWGCKTGSSCNAITSSTSEAFRLTDVCISA